MRRNLMASLALGLILAFTPFQHAQAGERRNHLPLAAKVNSKIQSPSSKGGDGVFADNRVPKQSLGTRAGNPSSKRESGTASEVSGAGRMRSVAEAGRGLRSNVAGEYSFSAVTPLAPKPALGNEVTARATFVAAQAKDAGPTTAPSERKAVTFFRLNPKFGDVSVQPVFGGGVNGAQLAVGF